MSAPFVVAPRVGSTPPRTPETQRSASVDVARATLPPEIRRPRRATDDPFPAGLAFTPVRAERASVEPVTDATRAPISRHPALAPLSAWLDDPEVTDVFLNGADGLYVDRGHGAERDTRWRASEQDVRALAVTLISLGGRHVDDSSPCVDVRLDDGMRVHAVLPPISPDGTLVSLRVPRLGRAHLDELRARGMFGPQTAARLAELVESRENLLVTGAAGAGKTTLLAALLAGAASTDRIVTIEDVAELRIDHPHQVRLESRQPNLEGVGGVGLSRLVREALRMRPDRLVLGECRGEEVRDLLSALNTGHDGGAGTVHANGIRDVAARLEALGALAGLDGRALARQVVSAIGWILHIERDASGRRRLAGMGRPVLEGDRLGIEEVPCPD